MSPKAKHKLKIFGHLFISLVLFLLSLATLHGGPDSILLVAAAILFLPISELQDWLNEKFGRAWVKYLVIAVLVVLGIVLDLTENKDKIYTIDQSTEIIEGIEQGILEDEGMTKDEYIQSK